MKYQGHVAILGAGPAGLLAAHAAKLNGFEPEIISAPGGPSKLYGAQYLHKRIPALPHDPPVRVQVELRGTAEDYREKVYGADYRGPVSPQVLESGHEGYDIRQAYDWLCRKYYDHVNLFKFEPRYFAEFAADRDRHYAYIFSSIPLVQLCYQPEHDFNATQVYAIGDAPDIGIQCPVRTEDNMIWYDATRETSWYRASRIFGHSTAEWPATKKKPPISGLAIVSKPLSTNCTCGPNVTRIGRYGQWKKGVLAHTAFEQVDMILKGLGVQSALF